MIFNRVVEDRLGAVVVEHQVLLREHDAAHPLDQLVACGIAVGRAGALDEHTLGVAQGVAERDQVVLAQRAAGADDVGDGVGDAELDRDLHGAVEADDRGLDTACGQVVAHQVGVGRGDPQPREVLDRPVLARGSGVPERGAAEAERQPLGDRGTRVAGEVAAGDAEIEFTGSDVDRDVLGAQEEELDLVGRVEDGQVAGVGATAVTGLAEDFGGGLGQRALVGDCDAQHGGGFLSGAGGGVSISRSQMSVDVLELQPLPTISTCAQYSS